MRWRIPIRTFATASCSCCRSRSSSTRRHAVVGNILAFFERALVVIHIFIHGSASSTEARHPSHSESIQRQKRRCMFDALYFAWRAAPVMWDVGGAPKLPPTKKVPVTNVSPSFSKTNS